MEQGPTFRVAVPKYPTDDPNYRILSKTRQRYTHYYFYLRDRVLGPMVLRVATYLPFPVSAWINGHSFMARELEKANVPFTKNDNAFTGVGDPKQLQAAANRLTPELIEKRLNEWTFLLGPKFSQRERTAMDLRRYWAMNQVEYCYNIVLRPGQSLRRLFQRACDLGLAAWTASHIAQVFGWRLTRKLKGKLQTVVERFGDAHGVLRAYFKNSFAKMYEKMRRFLRLEVCSNNLTDLRMKKSLKHLPRVREAFLAVLDRFASTQAQTFGVHVDFPLLQRLALPIVCGRSRLPGIHIHDTRIIRLMEVLLHGGSTLHGWTSATIHRLVVETYGLQNYSLTQLRYDLRKMKAHGLIARHGRHYTYFLTHKGTKVAALLLLIHKRLCGPLANSLFQQKPAASAQPPTPLEAAYHKADEALEQIVELLAA